MTTPSATTLNRLLRQGFLALVIKIGAAGLSFLMFLALARALPADAFGQFGFAFSLATLLSVLGSFGQRTLALKYASIYVADRDQASLSALVRFGYGHILAAGALLALGVAAIGISTGPTYLILVGPLAIAMSIAEYQAHFLRAYGTMVHALAPRDILWRACVILVAAATLMGLYQMTTAFSALCVLTITLLVICAGQLSLHAPMRNLLRQKTDAPIETRQRWRHASLGLWGTSFVQSAGPNMAVVLLGLILSPAETGPFFSALRIAMVLSLFLMAANMAGASVIARSYAAEDRALLQQVCTSVARFVSIPTGMCFVLFWLLGPDILQLFGTGYDQAFIPLMILSAGYLISALMGPTIQIMETTGHERPYLRILTVSTCIFLVLMPVVIYFADVIGAALVISANMVVTRALCYRFIQRNLLITPGIFKPPQIAFNHE